MIPSQDTSTEILKFIKAFIDEHKYCPSVREIADSQGFSSTNSVHYYIQKLVAAGKIERPHGSARTIIVTDGI